MPYIRIWIHAVWATKKRFPYLTKDVRYQIFQHIRENAKNKNIHLDHINGHLEHVHCLISMDATHNIASIIQLLKGESSFWINKNKLTEKYFGWQDEYFAGSVSHSQINAVRRYIQNQEKHHANKTFEDEYQKFIKKYGFEIFI
ncbi:MAG: IS200/IS605 family transposase [Saprospiraceae bacterium]|nr:IS200/IS605 family transposase [Saprospiraceae bacterium]MCB9324265.1 IS200/IS605 family transposase [Lewinellaceae bacterium]